MKKIVLLIILIGVFSCSSDTKELIVKGTIKDLKKGTLYLQKVQDTALISLDSVDITGESEFLLSTPIEEPELFYIMLDKNAKDKDRIAFFGTDGITEIHTSLKNFAFNAKITGSNQQKLLEDYKKITNRLNDRNLKLIKENFEALKNDDTLRAFEIGEQQKSLITSRYFSTINFALNNKTSQVAPYLALSEIYDVQLKYLDTIYISLPDSIASSKYGKKLKQLIEDRRKLEKK